MIKIIFITTLLFTASIAGGQIVIKQLAPKEVDSLLRLLNKRMDDTARISISLSLAEYYLMNWAERPSLDSGAIFITRSKQINAKQTSRKYDGIILIYESWLNVKRGDTAEAQKIALRAIASLQAVNDEYHTACAYLALARCYNHADTKLSSTIKNVYNSAYDHATKVIGKEQRLDILLEFITFYWSTMYGENRLMRVYFLDQFVKTGRILNNTQNEFLARKEIANLNYKLGNIDLALRQLLEIAKEQKLQNAAGVCFTYDLLATVYFSIFDYDKSLSYAFETLKNIHTDLDSFYLPEFYSRIAACYSRTGSRAEAIDWNLKRLNYEISVRKMNFVYWITSDIIGDMIRLGRSREALGLILKNTKSIPPASHNEKIMMLLSLAKCYAAVNNKESARSYCEELIGFLELIVKRKETSSDFPTFEFWADEFLSSFYLDDAQYSKAEIYFKKALALWETTSKESSVLFRNRFLFKLDSARGNYISAIRHLQTLQLQNDSIYNVTKSKQIEELKINYATEQKDSIINLKEQNIKLLTQQDQFQKSKLQQEALLRNISFAIATLLIIIVALLYNRYRLKQRTNKKLELQQEEIARKNLSLQNLVKEKDWLVKEIHHRVKNNLQIVMSLLNSQSAYINNERALTAIHDSQHRVHAMSLIHQKLYNTENVSSIDISLYIREMVSYLSESFNTGQRIRFEYDIKPLEMDVSQAVPLGLILNEAITNSIKYAFPDDRSGVISISLSDTSPNQCLLVMSDNGVGMPQQFDSKKPGSLGMSLMEGLSEDLDGKFSIENKNGTTIKVSFAHDVNVKRPEVFAPLIVSNY